MLSYMLQPPHMAAHYTFNCRKTARLQLMIKRTSTYVARPRPGHPVRQDRSGFRESEVGKSGSWASGSDSAHDSLLPRTTHQTYRTIRLGTERRCDQSLAVTKSTRASRLRTAAPRSGPFGSREFGKESSDDRCHRSSAKRRATA
jgi:hypothetical protein